MKYLDIFGNEIKVGDVVAYSASYLDSSALRIARVDELKQQRPRYEGDDMIVPSILLTALESTLDDNPPFRRMQKRVTIHSNRLGRFHTVTILSGVDFQKLYDTASTSRW